MLRRLALLALVALPQGEDPGPTVRVEAGAAKVVEGDHVRALSPGTAPLALQAGLASLEAGARSELEIVWRGAASARISGPATLELHRTPELLIADFRVAELEVRRGKLVLELPELGPFELGEGVLQVRTLPGGVVELQNLGGSALVLRRTGRDCLEIPAGRRVRIRAEA